MKVRSTGFTIIELTLVLALIGVFMGMVIVRFNFGSPRQHMIDQARKLGNAICTYREKAISDERVYVLEIDLEANTWRILGADEKNPTGLQSRKPLCHGALDAPLKFRAVQIMGVVDVPSPAILYFDPRGVVPDSKFQIGAAQGASVSLHIDPLVNEVAYDEQ